ncbi:hypothetical protein [Nocardia farcinica]|uniref:hypothetical protein n=1 Tax=Nocardia farcinica TaxID=37329 RepID=UPI001893FCB6|nr:hypothetical protein [Nocardia farcinica]MBF6254468.1 hypothetical protein [Nocardia farcinica]
MNDVDDEQWRWLSYLWDSDTGEPILQNLYGIRNLRELAAREYAETTKRSMEMGLLQG